MDSSVSLATTNPLKRAYSQARGYVVDPAYRQGINTGAGKLVSQDVFNYAKGVPGAVWKNPYGKAATIALGARYIAYPLFKGNIDAETRYGIAKSPIGSFLTGEDQNSPDLLDSVAAQAADEQEAKNRALLIEEQARAEQQYRDRARFDSNMSYNNAQDMLDLELGGQRLQGQYDLTAGLLANATRNYAAAMNDNTNAIANLLGPRIQLR